MGRIFCIMGKSASGKDSIYRELLKKLPELGTYVMYTTRPMREGEEDGTSYHFTTEDAIQGFKKEGKLIEARTYETVYGPWTYATIDDGQIDLHDKDYLIPATLESYNKLKSYYGAELLYPIYIEVEDGERLMRAIAREKKEEKPKYKELCRRFLADAEDFSEEHIDEAGIVTRFENYDLNDCVDQIISVIKNL